MRNLPTPRGFHGDRDQAGGAYMHGGYDPDFLGPSIP